MKSEYKTKVNICTINNELGSLKYMIIDETKDGRYAIERFMPEKDIIGRVFLARGVEGIRLVDKSEVRHIHEEEV